MYRNLKNIFWNLYKIIQRKYNDLFGTKNYQKIIIISRSRSGSNLLISLLNSHSKIKMEGELFKRMDGHLDIQDLWDAVFANQSKNIDFYGCKIFYYHPLQSNNEKIWDLILNEKNIKIIHLVRSNLLKTIVSKYVAEKTGQWTRKKTRVISLDHRRVRIDPEEMLEKINQTKRWIEQTRTNYQNKDFLEIKYEDLVANPKKTMNSIFKFLGCDNEPVYSSLRKQNPNQWQSLVHNAGEIETMIREKNVKYKI